MMKIFSYLCFAACSCLSAQTIEYGTANLESTQDDPTTGAMALDLHFVKASVPAGSEGLISLGEFSIGYHQLMISATGHSANSSAIIDFSIGYNNYGGYNSGENVRFHELKKFNWQSNFSVYFKKKNAYTTNIYLLYNNGSPSTNNIHVGIMASNPGSWLFQDVNVDPELSELTLADPMIEMNNERPSPTGEPVGMSINTGLHVNRDAEFDGDVILKNPQGDISMGVYE